MLRKPSSALARQNGSTIATSMKMTVRLETLNQTTPRMAQPTDGKLFRMSRMRRSTTAAKTGEDRASMASVTPSAMAMATAAITRAKLMPRCQASAGSVAKRASVASTVAGPGSTNSGRLRAVSHQPTTARSTAPSARPCA